MYAIYHQIDREKKEQEEKENEQNLVEELKQLEAKYNQLKLLRRDSFSTITTHDTQIIIEAKIDRKQLVPITWAQNGELPVEISVPETTQRMDENLLERYESGEEEEEEEEEKDSQALEPLEPPKKKQDTVHILHNTLFVDDEDELDLIFDDNQEDEMNVQRTLGTPSSRDVSLISSSSSESSEEEEEQSFYTDSTSCDSEDEDLLRFETERFTRFEI